MLCLPAFTPVANDAHAVGDSGECVVVERAHAAAALRELLHVRQLAFVHPLLDELRIHPVEAEDDELLPELFAARAACRTPTASAEANDKQREQDAFHRMLGSGKL